MPKPDSLQLRAIQSRAGTIMVTGGPGAGKTHLLVERFLHLVDSEDVPVSSILVLTFSSAAATMLRRTIEDRIARSYDKISIHTFHSFALRILTDHALQIGEAAEPVFISPFREYLAVKYILAHEGHRLESRFKTISSNDGLAREISDFLGLLKQNLVTPEELNAATGNSKPEMRDIARLYSTYETYMNERNWIGVRSAVACAVHSLEANKRLLAEFQGRFSNILVDEFQEVDHAQFCLLSILGSGEPSVFVTGDEEQRIFRFRGSGTNQFDKVARGKPDAELIRLEGSHRFPGALEDASRNLIAENRGTNEKAKVALDGNLRIRRHRDPIEQAYWVARDIKNRVLDSYDSEHPLSFSDFAIICRSTSRSALPLEEAFSYYDIPYTLYGITNFYKHPMVKCMADMLRLVANPDDDATLLRVIRAPTFGLSAIEIARLVNSGRALQVADEQGSLYSALKRSGTHERIMSALDVKDNETAVGLEKFIRYFDDFREEAIRTDCPTSVVHSVMQKLFFRDILTGENVGANIRDARNLHCFFNMVDDIENVVRKSKGSCGVVDVVDHLEHAFAHFSSLLENDLTEEAVEGVRVMTVHQAKGSEFPFVYLVDMTDEFFPLFAGKTSLLDEKSLKSLCGRLEKQCKSDGRQFELALSSEEHLREERQLAYVAISRAKRLLTIGFTEESHFSEVVPPSPFLQELLGTSPEIAAQADSVEDERIEPGTLLASALNTQEIESALRTCLQGLRPSVEREVRLSTTVESMNLDAGFVFGNAPFETDPPAELDLCGHTFSASQLSTYLTCPRRFYFERLLRIAPERPEDFGLGQLVHQVIERFHKHVKEFTESRGILEPVLHREFLTVWRGDTEGEEAEAPPFYRQFSTELQRSAIRTRAEEILDRYLRTELSKAKDRQIVGCEEYMHFDVRGYPFVAKIDRIDISPEGHHIIDHKTSGNISIGAKTIKKKFLNLDKKDDFSPQDFQLPLYLIAARTAGYDPVELCYYWLGSEDSKGMFKRGSVEVGDDGPDSLTSSEMEEVEESICDIVGQIMAGRFETGSESRFECSRCSFDQICSAS